MRNGSMLIAMRPVDFRLEGFRMAPAIDGLVALCMALGRATVAPAEVPVSAYADHRLFVVYPPAMAAKPRPTTPPAISPASTESTSARCALGAVGPSRTVRVTALTR